MPEEPIRLEEDPERVLETPRLRLEPLTVDHAADLFPLLGDERLYRFIPQDPPVSLDALAARYGRLATRRSPDGREAWLNWALRRRDEPAELVGLLEASVSLDRSAFVAYTVFVPYQRQGYAAEGVGRLLAHLFDDYRLALVTAEVDTRNEASIALLERFGFARVGTTVDADHFKGASSDEYRYERRPPTPTPSGVSRSPARSAPAPG